MKSTYKNGLFFLIMFCLMLVSCGESGGNSTTNPQNPKTITNTKFSDIDFLSSINGKSTKSYVYFHNYGTSLITNPTFNVLDSGGNLTNNITIDATSCKEILPNSYCMVGITTPELKYGDVHYAAIIAKTNGVDISKEIFYYGYTKVDFDADTQGMVIAPISTTTIANDETQYHINAFILINNPDIDPSTLTLNIDNPKLTSTINCNGGNDSGAIVCSADLSYKNKINQLTQHKSMASDSAVSILPIAKSKTSGKEIKGIATAFKITNEATPVLVTNTNTIISSGATRRLVLSNFGNSSSKNLSITSNEDNIKIIDDNCSGKELKSFPDECSYTVSINETAKKSSSGIITIKNDSAISNTVNVTYTVPNVPGMQSSIQPDTITAVIGKDPAYGTLEIQNNGNIDLQKIITVFDKHQDELTIESSTCLDTLAMSNKCSVSFKYTPNIISDENVKLNISATYYDNGEPKQITNEASFKIQSIQPKGILHISSKESSDFNIIANGVDSKLITYQVKNDGDETAYNPQIAAIADGFISSTTCKDSLNSADACSIDVTYGPTTTEVTESMAELALNYQPYKDASVVTTTYDMHYQATSPNNALITIATLNAWGDTLSGDGKDKPFLVQKQGSGGIDIKYTNISNGSATISKVSDVYGYDSDKGCDNKTLGITDSCSIHYTVNNKLGVFNLDLPTITYTDEGHPKSTTTKPSWNDTQTVKLSVVNPSFQFNGVESFAIGDTVSLELATTDIKAQTIVAINVNSKDLKIPVSTCTFNSSNKTCKIDGITSTKIGNYSIIATIDGDTIISKSIAVIDKSWAQVAALESSLSPLFALKAYNNELYTATNNDDSYGWIFKLDITKNMWSNVRTSIAGVPVNNIQFIDGLSSPFFAGKYWLRGPGEATPNSGLLHIGTKGGEMRFTIFKNTIYAVSDGEIKYSIDNGITWNTYYAPKNTDEQNILGKLVTMSSNNIDGTLYIGTSDDGIFRVTSNSMNTLGYYTPGWLSNYPIYQITNIGDKVYSVGANTRGKILTCNVDTKGCWVIISTDNPTGGTFRSIHIIDNIIYAGTDNGYIYKVDSKNPTWVQVGQPITNSKGIYSLEHIGNNLYAGTGNGQVYQFNLGN